MPFHPERFELFRIRSFEADPEGATALLHYSLDDEYHFTERIEFGKDSTDAPSPMSPGQRSAFEAAVRLLHITAGVSYYKTAATRRIAVETGVLSDAELRLCRDIYDRGLREFAYRNGLAVPRRLEIFSATGGHRLREAPREAPRRGVAVPVSGGKDSIVVLEALRGADGLRPLLVSVNPSPAVERIAAISGLPLARMRRQIDPLLLDLNDRGALNGHVPVTAIVSLIAVAGGYVHGYDTTVMSLEASADSPTRVLGAQRSHPQLEEARLDEAELDVTEVNHQWSKSAEFEAELREVLGQSVHRSIGFLSPLRCFDELEITGAFAGMTPYFSAFRSCNRAFRMSDPFDGWCLECPKCRFVFLALATAVSRDQVVAVFGADLLDDVSQTEGFLDLLDHRRKPFECVGTVDEVAEAMCRLLDDPAWSGASVLEQIRPVLAGTPASDRRERVSGQRVLSDIREAVARTSPTRTTGRAP